MLVLTYAAEEASSSAKRFPEGSGQNAGRAFVVRASSLKLCGGCQRLTGWGGVSRRVGGS